VHIDEGDELVNVVQEGAPGLALLDLDFLCGVARHCEDVMTKGTDRQIEVHGSSLSEKGIETH